MNQTPALTIRPMVSADISLGLALRALAGWNQTEGDWRRLFELNPAGCFVAEAAGRPVGTATTTVHEGRVGWIGMVLVHPNARGQGIGTALLEHAIAHLRQTGVASIKLDATPAGKRVYVPLGFRDEYELERVEAVVPHAAADHGEPPAQLDLEAVFELDRQAFGVGREAVLRRLFADAPESCWMVMAPASLAVAGYLLARPGANAGYIGPWVARSEAAADRLLRAALARFAGQRVFLDVPAAHPARTMVARYGFKGQRPLTRMWLGCNSWPGDTTLTFAIADPAKG